MALDLFDEAYKGVPPWDIGRPQREIVRLVAEDAIRGSVLDAGCGTGENALYLCAQGHEVWGIDASAAAIAKAKHKAEVRGLKVNFQIANALHLASLGRTFNVVIDSGLFHVFTDEERPIFVRELVSVLQSGGTYFLLCFSEHEPTEWGGPRRVTQAGIRTAFGDEGWKILTIRRALFDTNLHKDGGQAWLAHITRR